MTPRRLLLSAVLVAAAGMVAAAPTLGQQRDGLLTLKGSSTVSVWDPLSTDEILSASSNTRLPLFRYVAVSSRDGKRYSGVIVGQSPQAENKRATTITTQIIPLIVTTGNVVTAVDFDTGEFTTIPGQTTFDPTAADTACLTAPNNVPLTLVQQSPIFQPTDFTFGPTFVGNTQYVDAFQRANFWQSVADTEYHTLLSPIETLSAIHVDAPSGIAMPVAQIGLSGCGMFGTIDFDSFDELLVSTIIPALAAQGVNSTTLPIFLLHNMGLQIPPFNGGKVLFAGYHGSRKFQTYAVAEYDSAGAIRSAVQDVSIVAHEVVEWMNDPFNTNRSPAWGHVGQEVDCQKKLEVADPLTGTYIPVTMPNNFTYHPQESAFFSWFFGAPSIAVNGWFSNNNSFTSDAGPICRKVLSSSERDDRGLGEREEPRGGP